MPPYPAQLAGRTLANHADRNPYLPFRQASLLSAFVHPGLRKHRVFSVPKMAERNLIAAHDTARSRLMNATRKGFSTSLRCVATASRCIRRPRSVFGLRDYALTTIFGGTHHENTRRILSKNRSSRVSMA